MMTEIYKSQVIQLFNAVLGHITNTVVKAEQRPVRKLFEALKAKKRLAIAYTVEDNIRRWRDLYKDNEFPPWPPK